MPPKYASPYSLFKKPLQQTKVYTIYDAQNKKTNEIWLAKVFQISKYQQYNLQDHIGYNEQALQSLREKRNVSYVDQIFVKDGQLFFISQKYQTRLSDYLNSKNTLDSQQVQTIIQQAFQGLCDIYEEGYVHRNLRPEHFVKIAATDESQQIWKIETLVLNNQQFEIQTPFTWKKSSASPQQRNQKDHLDQEMLDSQLVWNFGYLALHLLFGNEWTKKQISKDSEIQWNRIKEATKGFPQLYELIEKTFRVKFSDRISLKKMFQLPIFANSNRLDPSQYFITASKIFKFNGFSSIAISSIKSKRIGKGDFQNKLTMAINKPNDQQLKIKKQVQNKSDIWKNKQQMLSVDLKKYLFLKQVNTYLEFLTCIPQDKIIIQYIYFILISMKLQDIKYQIVDCPESVGFKNRVNNELKQIQSLLKKKVESFQRAKNKKNSILHRKKIEARDIIDELQRKKIISIINKISGFAYTLLKQEEENKQKPILKRSVAYFTLAVYFINVEKIEETNEIQTSDDFIEKFNQLNEGELLAKSQMILKKYFKTQI